VSQYTFFKDLIDLRDEVNPLDRLQPGDTLLFAKRNPTREKETTVKRVTFDFSVADDA